MEIKPLQPGIDRVGVGREDPSERSETEGRTRILCWLCLPHSFSQMPGCTEQYQAGHEAVVENRGDTGASQLCTNIAHCCHC